MEAANGRLDVRFKKNMRINQNRHEMMRIFEISTANIKKLNDGLHNVFSPEWSFGGGGGVRGGRSLSCIKKTISHVSGVSIPSLSNAPWQHIDYFRGRLGHPLPYFFGNFVF